MDSRGDCKIVESYKVFRLAHYRVDENVAVVIDEYWDPEVGEWVVLNRKVITGDEFEVVKELFEKTRNQEESKW